MDLSSNLFGVLPVDFNKLVDCGKMRQKIEQLFIENLRKKQFRQIHGYILEAVFVSLDFHIN